MNCHKDLPHVDNSATRRSACGTAGGRTQHVCQGGNAFTLLFEFADHRATRMLVAARLSCIFSRHSNRWAKRPVHQAGFQRPPAVLRNGHANHINNSFHHVGSAQS